MIVDDTGYVQLRPADRTPNHPSSQKAGHRDYYAVANPTVFANSLKKMLTKCRYAKNPLQDFDEIPGLFPDNTNESLAKELQRSNARDKETHVLFAVPS
jgi:hypothetical protein